MSPALLPATLEALQRFRERRTKLLCLRAALAAGGVLLGLLMVVALLDKATFMPDEWRVWLSGAAYVTALIAAWRLGLRFIHEAHDERGAARLLEQADSSLREQLLSAVELAHGGEDLRLDGSPEFRAHLQREVATRLGAFDARKTLPLRLLSPAILGASGMALLLIALSLAPALHLPGFMARAALPFVNLPRPSSTKIHITNPSKGDALAAIGSTTPLNVELEGQSAQHVLVETRSEGSPALRSELSASASNRFEGGIPVGQGNVRYRVFAGDAVSEWRTLKARPRPAVTQVIKTIVPPAYTGLPEKSVTDDHGDLRALDGSTVKLTLKSNQPLSQASATLLPNNVTVPVTLAKPDELQASVVLDGKADSWQLALTAEETGFTNEEAAPWRIETVPDLPPTVTITQPQEQLEVRMDDTVQISGEAEDDIGLAKVELCYAINGADWKNSTLTEKAGMQTTVSTPFKLAPLPVKTGDAVLVKLAATDLKGQRSESTPVRLLVMEDRLNLTQREWAHEQRDLAKRAMELASQTRDMLKDVDRARASQKKANNNPDDDGAAALARLKQNLESARERSDDLWNELKNAAKDAPDSLATLETEIAGKQLAEIRGQHLREALEETHAEQTNPQKLKQAVVMAMARSQQLADALRSFAAAHAAQAARENFEHLAPQQNRLADRAIEANRDVATRPKWQEQQRAALEAARKAREDLLALEEVTLEGRKRDVEYQVKNLADKMPALQDALDRPDQHQAPEFVYGQSHELRNAVNQARDASRWLADEATQNANEMRERLLQQQNPALTALDQARGQTEVAVGQKRDTPKAESARTNAAEKLAAAARQLKDQSELREQNPRSNSSAALDMNRLGRALDQVKQSIEHADTREKAQQVAAQTRQLTDTARVLQAEAVARDAAQALDEARQSEMNDDAPDAHAAAAQTAANELKQLPEALRQSQADNQAVGPAQEAANNAQWQRDEVRNQQNMVSQQKQNGQAAQLPQAKDNRALQANNMASKKLDEALEKFSPKVTAARQALQQLTPKLSELAKNTASELRQSAQQTQQAADAAKQKPDAAQTAQQASALLPKSEDDAEKLADLQTAVRQEADQADLAQETQRQMARSADVGLEQMRRQTPQITQNLQQAAKAQETGQQAQALQSAAQAQAQTADSVDKLAQNLAKAEQGQQLPEDALAAQQAEEQSLEIKKPLDESYGEAKNLSDLMQKAQQDPQAALTALENELKRNTAMQRALGELAEQTAMETQNQVAMAQQQPQTAAEATQNSAHDLERVARHETRLGQQKAAQQITQASQQLQQLAQQPPEQAPQNMQQAAQQTQRAQAEANDASKDQLTKTPPPASVLELAKGAMLAQALDELDQSLNPMQRAQKADQAQGSPQPNQEQGDSAQKQMQQAQQSLSQASKAQSQSMAQARAQGQVPGQKQQQQAAQNNNQKGRQQNQHEGQEAADATGNMVSTNPNLIVPTLEVSTGGDWGHLPSRMAHDLSEASRQEPSPEYRAEIESYYKAIAEKARK